MTERDGKEFIVQPAAKPAGRGLRGSEADRWQAAGQNFLPGHRLGSAARQLQRAEKTG